MKAKIIDKEGNYLSPVFGMAETECEKCLVLNKEKNALIFAPIYANEGVFVKRKIFVFGSAEDWVEKKIPCGNANAVLYVCPLLEPFIDNIFDEMPIPEIVKDEVLLIAGQTTEQEWNEVKDEKSVAELMSFCGGFHDGVIEQISYRAESENQGELTVEIGGCWGADITLLFEGYPHFHFRGCNFYYIYDSTIFFKDNRIIFVDDELQNPDQISDDDVWFSAETLKWKYDLKQ